MYQAHARELLNKKESGNTPEMTKNAQHPIYRATERLVSALDRLEGNLRHMPATGAHEERYAQQISIFEHENEALKGERENLNNAIAQLRYQYDDLHHVASTIYGKLNDSIKRLTHIIDN